MWFFIDNIVKSLRKRLKGGKRKEYKRRRLKGFVFCGNVSKRRERKMEEQKKIYIGNLEYGVTEGELKQLLEEKGVTAEGIKLISDRDTGRPKGFGFAEFSTEEDAVKAIDILNDFELNGRKLKANKAQKMKPRRDNFGGGGNSGGGGGGYNRGSRY